MNVGDLVECKLEIYGLGIVLNTKAKIGYENRITVQWFDPPEWLMNSSKSKISTHKPSNLEVLCK